MSPLPSLTALNRALFLCDPMHTCCVENDCHDEYERIATGILERLQDGQSMESALRTELSDWFDIDMAGRAYLTPVLALLESP
ncbi:MAG: hypothetical protein V7681_18705 [Halopseudomonas sabulinigri]